MRNLFYLFAILIVSCTTEVTDKDQFQKLTGPYLGQELPGDSAVLFAPHIVSSGMADRDITISPDGKELFFTRILGGFTYNTIFYTKQMNGIWSKPEVFKYCTDARYKYTEPFITIDGEKLFFASNKPVNGKEPASFDIWVCEKNENNEWGEPYNLGEPINTDQNEFFPTLTADGTIYFNHFDAELNDEFIYRSKLVDGEYTSPEKLCEKVNAGQARFNAFIAPDESFIIIPTYGMPDSKGATDYYIVFRDEYDNWSNPINMGEQINSENGQEWSASISPDGKYLFYMSAKIPEEQINTKDFSSDLFDQIHNSPQNGLSDIYWVSTDFIKELKKQAKF